MPHDVRGRGDCRRSPAAAEAQGPWLRIPRPEESRTEDIAPAAVFLASPDSAWITGETLHITGGLR
jgi:3-oxoacyl-[acyl-carrier protein] reductase